MVIVHEIIVPLSDPAQIEFSQDRVTVKEGLWPSFGDLVQAEGHCSREDDIRYYYLHHSGYLVGATDFLPYGRNLAGKDQAMLDLVAWRMGEDWHVKRLIPARTRL